MLALTNPPPIPFKKSIFLHFHYFDNNDNDIPNIFKLWQDRSFHEIYDGLKISISGRNVKLTMLTAQDFIVRHLRLTRTCKHNMHPHEWKTRTKMGEHFPRKQWHVDVLYFQVGAWKNSVKMKKRLPCCEQKYFQKMKMKICWLIFSNLIPFLRQESGILGQRVGIWKSHPTCSDLLSSHLVYFLQLFKLY